MSETWSKTLCLIATWKLEVRKDISLGLCIFAIPHKDLHLNSFRCQWVVIFSDPENTGMLIEDYIGYSLVRNKYGRKLGSQSTILVSKIIIGYNKQTSHRSHSNIGWLVLHQYFQKTLSLIFERLREIQYQEGVLGMKARKSFIISFSNIIFTYICDLLGRV